MKSASHPGTHLVITDHGGSASGNEDRRFADLDITAFNDELHLSAFSHFFGQLRIINASHGSNKKCEEILEKEF